MKSEQIKQWTSTTTLADEAVVRSGKSIYKGPIFMISERGINVGTGFGVYFFKWEHVLTIDKYKKKKKLKPYIILYYNRFACQNQLWRVDAENEFRAGRAFYQKHNRKSYHDCIETIYEG